MNNGFLLDTNVISETRKPRPNSPVLHFLESKRRDQCFLSVVSLGELRFGEYRWSYKNPDKFNHLTAWVDSIEADYRWRLLDVTAPIADRWAQLARTRDRLDVDAIIAATAIVHKLTVVTRNVKDFADPGMQVINPWQE